MVQYVILKGIAIKRCWCNTVTLLTMFYHIIIVNYIHNIYYSFGTLLQYYCKLQITLLNFFDNMQEDITATIFYVWAICIP